MPSDVNCWLHSSCTGEIPSWCVSCRIGGSSLVAGIDVVENVGNFCVVAFLGGKSCAKRPRAKSSRNVKSGCKHACSAATSSSSSSSRSRLTSNTCPRSNSSSERTTRSGKPAPPTATPATAVAMVAAGTGMATMTVRTRQHRSALNSHTATATATATATRTWVRGRPQRSTKRLPRKKPSCATCLGPVGTTTAAAAAAAAAALVQAQTCITITTWQFPRCVRACVCV